jgi:UDP-glucuronate decarboxylase
MFGAIMVKRLLITGGTGFFGKALLRHFHAEAMLSTVHRPNDFNEIIVISRNPESFAVRFPELAHASWLRWVRADLCRKQSLSSLLNGETVDSVLHAASDSTDAAGLSHLEKLDQIVEGTRNLLELSVRLQARRFLLTSSGGAYGPQPSEMLQIPESYCGFPDPLKMSSSYGIGKRMAEHLSFVYGELYGIEIVIARCFAFVGLDLPLDAHFAIGNFIRDALSREEITVAGDGSQVRSYMDQRDLSLWLTTMLQRGRPGHSYNLGSDKEILIRDLAFLVRDALAPSKRVRIVGVLETQNIRNRYIPSIEKAKMELQLGLNYSLEQSILSAVEGR